MRIEGEEKGRRGVEQPREGRSVKKGEEGREGGRMRRKVRR